MLCTPRIRFLDTQLLIERFQHVNSFATGRQMFHKASKSKMADEQTKKLEEEFTKVVLLRGPLSTFEKKNEEFRVDHSKFNRKTIEE